MIQAARQPARSGGGGGGGSHAHFHAALDFSSIAASRAGRRMEHERTPALSGDAPAVVVQQHVVVTTQEDATIDVGAALVFDEVVAMMRFAIRSRAVGTRATGIRHRAPRGRCAASRSTGAARDRGRAGSRERSSVNPTDPMEQSARSMTEPGRASPPSSAWPRASSRPKASAWPDGILHDDHAHAGLTRAEHVLRVREGSRPAAHP